MQIDDYDLYLKMSQTFQKIAQLHGEQNSFFRSKENEWEIDINSPKCIAKRKKSLKASRYPGAQRGSPLKASIVKLGERMRELESSLISLSQDLSPKKKN